MPDDTRVLSFICCESAVHDKRSGHVTLANCMDFIAVERLPHVEPHIEIFVELWPAANEYAISFSLVSPLGEPIVDGLSIRQQLAKHGIQRAGFALTDTPLPTEGKYVMQLYSGPELLVERPLWVFLNSRRARRNRRHGASG